MYTSAVTVAEVLCGIERLAAAWRQEELRSAATEVFGAFADQVLAFDAQIAAICRVRGAALATRNVSDFQETGIEIINLWEALAGGL